MSAKKPIELGPCPSEMKEGELYRVVKEGDKWRLQKVREKKVHVTTIWGPQAEAILRALNWRLAQEWRDKSVPGCAAVELWQESDMPDCEVDD